MSISLRTLVVELRRLGDSFHFPLTEHAALPVGAARRWGRKVMKKTKNGWKTARRPAPPPPGKRGRSAVAIITRDDGHVLMLQRGKREPWMPNKWNLPGGGVGRKEKPRDAARREAREEAGVKLGKLKKIGKFNIGDKEDLHVYHAHGHEGTPEHNFESKKLRWVHHSRAHKMRVVPSLKKILKHFSQKHAKKMFKE